MHVGLLLIRSRSWGFPMQTVVLLFVETAEWSRAGTDHLYSLDLFLFFLIPLVHVMFYF